MDAAGTKTDFGKGWGSVGPFSGIRGFGVATTRADAGGELVVPHEEVTFDGQEESYVGLRGRARFTPAARPSSKDRATSCTSKRRSSVRPSRWSSPTLVLCIGGTPGQPHAAPG